MDTSEDLEVDQDMENLLSTSNQHNIIITELPNARTIIQYYVDFIPWAPAEDESSYVDEDSEDDEDYEPVIPKGPECCICGEEAIQDTASVEYAGEFYTVVFKDEEPEPHNREIYGYLQCAYCFDFFHRRKCILGMSDSMYFMHKRNRSFVCAACVPEFKLMKLHCFANRNILEFNISNMLMLFNAFYQNMCNPVLNVPYLQICLNDINLYCKSFMWCIDKG
ncbi:unnamed protein product [Orchesella dallaii]|uniref:Uncharacterized protein n=1 Tax=Orchesella dallaii TaxID=48710 RepID=A0ABP1RWP8_9HEXA